MRKIYIVFSLFWITILIFSMVGGKFFEKKEENSKKEDKVVSLEADVIFELSGIILKKTYYGRLYYNVPRNICLYLKKDKEYIEIGSNQKYFWYFDNKEEILYYGDTSNVHNILKEIFNPINIIEIIFPYALNSEKEGVLEDLLIGDYGFLLKRKILIENYKIIDQKVYNEKGELLYTVKNYSHYKNIPTNLTLNYIKENCSVNIKLNNLKVNQKIIFSFDLPLKKYKKTELLTP